MIACDSLINYVTLTLFNEDSAMSYWRGIELCLDSRRKSQKFRAGSDCGILNAIKKYICMEKLRKTTNPPVGAADLRLILLNMKEYIGSEQKMSYAHTLSQQGLKPHDSRPKLATFPHWAMMPHQPFYKTLELERSTCHTAGRCSSTESENVQFVDIFHFSKPYTVLYSKWSDLQISTFARAIL